MLRGAMVECGSGWKWGQDKCLFSSRRRGNGG